MGVLCTADALRVAIRESSYHAVVTGIGTLHPVAIEDVTDTSRELALAWDGSAITEYREIDTHAL